MKKMYQKCKILKRGKIQQGRILSRKKKSKITETWKRKELPSTLCSQRCLIIYIKREMLFVYMQIDTGVYQ
jgi:hypothetical protein